MLDRKGIAHVMDFDIAKQHLAEKTDAATATGQALGTPEYMSPENARGDRVDFRSDIYSLGVMAYEMFTGEVPFRGVTPRDGAEAPERSHPRRGPRAERIPASLVPVLARPSQEPGRALQHRPRDRGGPRGRPHRLPARRAAHAAPPLPGPRGLNPSTAGADAGGQAPRFDPGASRPSPCSSTP